MKKTIIALFGLLPLTLLAQVDRSKAPQPGPAPAIRIGQPATFTLPNGLKVFVVENTKLPRVSATLSFNMDGIVEGQKAGLTSMGGELLRRGTVKMNKAQLDEAIDQLGGNIGTSAFSASASSLKANFPKLISLLSDVVLRPSFSATELEKIRRQELSGLQAAKDDPNSIADNVTNRLLYGKDHPYGDIETEETVSNVKVGDIKNFFSTYWKPNNAYLVFVGDITAADAKKLSAQYFGAWKSGVVPRPTYKTPQAPAKTFVAVVDRPASVQSVINFAAPVELKPGAPDVIPASVMNNILGGGFSGRLFANLREKHGFTYGAYSGLKSDRLVGAFTAEASVRNEKTDSAIAEFINEFNRIRTEAVPTDEESRMKNYLSGQFARSLENPATIAGFALNIAKYNLPKDYYQNYLKTLAAVSPTDVQAMAKKYVNPGNMLVVVVGNAKEIAKGLDKYGPVKSYNVYGQEVPAPTAKTVDASVTPQTILQKAIDAYGGASAIAAVKDLSMTGSASVQGMNINVTQKQIVPTAFVQEVSMQGMVLEKKLLKNGQYSQSGQGGAKPVDEKDKEEMNENAAFIPEVYMLAQKGYQFAVKGIEPVEGKDAYAVQVKTPAGREYTNFYDVATGLLVKKTTTQEGPQGTMTISSLVGNYKNVNGVNIPMKIVNDMGMMKIEINFNDVKVNSGLKAEDIK
ncbi:M16 family metallopeptidase [Flavisolibacter nicotianae]|uniref:M16 family metallopeptidase n=1 Tax=Flavisolibacter nicotianae TaxID=2364882 RepID=UPI000EB062B3|nr:pitrilysin family protein [Flavisolibacter nicotianae]